MALTFLPTSIPLKNKECTPISSSTTYNAPFSSDELLPACRAATRSTHYRMLRHLPPTTSFFLLIIFNKMWTTGNFPPHQLQALTLPLHKPKKSSALSQDYRPIDLTSCYCKLLERMVNLRLMWNLESHSFYLLLNFDFVVFEAQATQLHILKITSHLPLQASVLAALFDPKKNKHITWWYHILQ